MLRIINKPIFLLKNFRKITTTARLKNDNPTSSKTEKNNKFDSSLHATSRFDKRLLVMSKKYAKIEDVPALVPLDVMQKATSQLRIRVANLIIFFTIIIFLITAIVGKSNMKDKLDEMKILHDDSRREMIANLGKDMK